ncbi:response regulator [Flavobacterium seoulense]|uniref:Chemotaxis protein CheY n=1 Tax=Flavobacterium seoulense TaxID=1492738 RepID=A0A066WWE8_9FLAO|nr:response regulator [Flavobacterium seoulense]KDN54990.1 chemotaxis protein CheY [Flavobacterium seoulense]
MSKLSIFYADDDDDDLMFFNDAVESVTDKGLVKLHIHKNGENLVDTIKENKPQNGVVFLDLNMPKKSGFQILKEIRCEPDINNFPVIIYSTSADKSDIDLSLNLGANYYAVKPHNFSDLMKMIQNVMTINWNNHKVDINNFLLIK